MSGSSQVEHVLKRDGFGQVELVRSSKGRSVRRVACGGRVPGSRLLARLLLERERRALCALEGLPGVPGLEDDFRSKGVLVRCYVEGSPLHEAVSLPRDFFERLRDLVVAVHGRGVCHNDLHKEQNVIVRSDGHPALVDFQLASVHGRRGAVFRSRCREDLRHVEKHRRRYERRGGAAEPYPRSMRSRPRRSVIAWLWLVLGKPVYRLTADVLGARDGEPRRPSSGPWPEWTEPVGPP